MDYLHEQRWNQATVLDYLKVAGPGERDRIQAMCRDYLRFREDVAAYQTRYFQPHCRAACFQAQRSACCSKDGIITFFADVVINAVVSRPEEQADLAACLRRPRQDMKCLYLGPRGCRWQLKPIVCEMFLCDRAKEDVFGDSPDAGAAWEDLKNRELRFRWPDRAACA